MGDFLFSIKLLVILACGLLMFFRYRNTNVGIFGGIGFGALFLIPLIQRSLYGIGIPWYRAGFIFDFLFLAAYCMILYALFILPQVSVTGEIPFLKPLDMQKSQAARDDKQPESAGSPPLQAQSSSGLTQLLNRPFYLGSIFGSTTISFILFIVALMMVVDNDEEEAIMFWFLGFIIAAFGIVVFCMLVHTMWKVIQDGRARTTPGKAVGLLFVPFYNFYWIFQAFLGWAEDFNHYIKERNIKTPEISTGFVKTMCIIGIIQAIPYLGLALSLFYMMMTSIFIDRIIDGVNAVINYKAALQNQGDIT